MFHDLISFQNTHRSHHGYVPSPHPAGRILLVRVEDDVGVTSIEFAIILLWPVCHLELLDPPYLQPLLLPCSLPGVLTLSTRLLDLHTKGIHWTKTS